MSGVQDSREHPRGRFRSELQRKLQEFGIQMFVWVCCWAENHLGGAVCMQIVPVVPSSKIVVVGKAALFSTHGPQTYLLIGGCSPTTHERTVRNIGHHFPQKSGLKEIQKHLSNYHPIR